MHTRTTQGLILAGLTLLLTACAAPGPKRPEWSRPGATTMELNQDRYDCEQRHTSHSFLPGGVAFGGGYRPRLDENLFRSCMRARGWVHKDD
jgi:hypothetical protein